MHKKRVALILSLLALGLTACGGDDEGGDGTIPTVPLSVPGDDTNSIDEDVSTGTTVETTPDESVVPAPPPTPPPAPPAETPQVPDTPENDTPPPPGSEAEQFENFCAENPGAC